MYTLHFMLSHVAVGVFDALLTKSDLTFESIGDRSAVPSFIRDIKTESSRRLTTLISRSEHFRPLDLLFLRFWPFD